MIPFVAKLFSPEIKTAAQEEIMKNKRLFTAIVGLALLFRAGQAQAAEIKVFASTAVKTVLEELGPQFEKATGNKLAFTICSSRCLKGEN